MELFTVFLHKEPQVLGAIKIFDNASLSAAFLVLLGIAVGLLAWLLGRDPRLPLVIFGSLAIICPTHAVRLYWRNDSMIGGLPRANYSYTGGLVILSSGNVLVLQGFILGRLLLVYAGSLLLIIGIGLLVGASSLLFKRIVRGGLRSQR